MKHATLLAALLAGILASAAHAADEVGIPFNPFDAAQPFPDRLALPGIADGPVEGLPRELFPAEPRREGVKPPSLSLRMAGEFEQQQLLLLSCGELTLSYAETIADIAAATCGHIHVMVLVAGDEQRSIITRALNQRVDSLHNISLVHIPHDSKWIRDFGPTVVRNGSRPLVVDWQYEVGRPNDDLVPLSLAAFSGTACETAPLIVEGGNLITNGQGLCVTTTALLDRNADAYLDDTEVCETLKQWLGAQQVVVLEPLAGEGTGHVDMFLTFTGPNAVVVGSYRPSDDPENAALLDRNAARLASLTTPHGPLRVERIPMGAKHDGLWRTYTNCIYANGVLLVPAYRDDNQAQLRQVLALYRRLLPQWHIELVDATELIEQGGALHCASLNITRLARPLKPAPEGGHAPGVVAREVF